MTADPGSPPVFTHGDWIQVFVDPDPEGGAGFIRIEERSGAPGVCILPLSRDDVGLVTVHRRLLGATVLEIPRGFGGEGTGPRSDAVRELREETGLAVPEDDLHDLGTVAPNGSLLTARVRMFAAVIDDPSRAGSIEDRAEIGHFGWYPRHEVWSMITAGLIPDAFTHSALLAAALAGLVEFPGRDG